MKRLNAEKEQKSVFKGGIKMWPHFRIVENFGSKNILTPAN